MKVFVVGLDGATLELIAPWAAQGELPNFARILREGASGELTTVIPPMTAPAWASFATGKNPGKHGIIDFIRRQEHSYDIAPINASARQGQSLWDIAGAAGLKVGIVNVPLTYPPTPVNGFMVTGMLTPSRACYTYPPELMAELDETVGGYRIHMKPSYSRGNVSEFLEDLKALTHKQMAATQHLMRSREWDLFTVVFRGPDGVQHAACHATDPEHPLYSRRHAARYGGAILDIYRQVDGHLGELMEALDEDTTLILMSDHGYGPLHQFIYVNNWLIKWGLVQVRPSFSSRLRWLAYRLGLSPVEVYDVVLRLGLGALKGMVTKGKNRGLLSSLFLSFDDVDWSRTTAYAVGNGGQIYVNLQGREPEGIVAPGAEYESVVARILDHLNEMVDPQTGERIELDVYRREELYAGECLELLPDIIFLPRDLRRMPFGEYEFGSHKLVGPAWSISGTHRMNGIAMMWGAGIAKETELRKAHIVDIAPTILALLGIAIPPDMDGRVLSEAFRDGVWVPQKANAPAPGPSDTGVKHSLHQLSDQEEAEVVDRLRGLGYVG